MMGRDCGIPDERWIDYHLGKLGRASSEALERHAESCAVCRSCCKRWADLLGTAAESADEGIGVQAVAADRAEEPAASGMYRSLRRRMAVRAFLRRAKRRPGRLAAACVCAALLATASVGLLRYPAASEQPAAALEAEHYARMHVPEGARLMELPGTRVISAPDMAAWPSSPSSIKPRRSLTVWINADTEELFVLMEGVLASEASDVQAWADSRSRLSNLGLLEFHSGQGHLYSRFREMAALEALRFTIEPKGGSELPTTPDSAHVRLASE